MLKSKSLLLAATIVAGLTGASANAATTPVPFVPTLTPLPAPGPNDVDNSLHGAGATSVQKLLVREFNCIGVNHKVGASGISGSGTSATNGSFSSVTAGKYTPASPTTANPALDCSVDANDIQPAFSAKYVGTGSGFGRQIWREFKDNFDGSAVGSGVTHVYNPFNSLGETGTPDARWSHVQYAISDSPIAPSDLTDYNNGGSSSTTGTFPGAAGSAGAAVQFPLFVLPVAIVYSPVYGVNATSAPMTFNAQWATTFNGVSLNALRLSRKAYCGIFNGYYKNWNASVFQILNKNTPLFDATNDTAARWATDGAPIRLAGRLDNSGTTNVFTRHLNAVCGLADSVPLIDSAKPGLKAAKLGAADTANYKNAYDRAADNLPYNSNNNGGVNLSLVREDSNYKPSNTLTTKVAGSTNLVSGTYYDGTNVVTQSGTTSGLPTGKDGSGLFVTADGGSKLAKYILLAPDHTLGTVTVNGKIGYISADAIPPSPDAAAVPSGAPVGTFLASALLQVSNGTGYAQPSLVQALKAFGTADTAILPPESDANGAYLAGDTRLVRSATSTSTAAVRENPVAWTDVLYVSNGGNNLAAPLAGYPIVGTTQFFGYTCYTATNRQAIVEVLGLALGGVTRNSTNASLSVNTFKGAAAANIGIFDQANIGVLPIAWQKALIDTFLQKSATTALADKNLYIQDIVQRAKSVKATPTPPEANANPTCSGKTGA
ncbi:substrate-binding domain-containing protein [Novosphingobium sp.]|uniref:substrate-binding domain-containing protein n=1 Tax=Novosphingobium sp. TaxID=1874826 RepID=UPI0038B6B480